MEQVLHSIQVIKEMHIVSCRFYLILKGWLPNLGLIFSVISSSIWKISVPTLKQIFGIFQNTPNFCILDEFESSYGYFSTKYHFLDTLQFQLIDSSQLAYSQMVASLQLVGSQVAFSWQLHGCFQSFRSLLSLKLSRCDLRTFIGLLLHHPLHQQLQLHLGSRQPQPLEDLPYLRHVQLSILGPGNCIWGIKISTEMPFRDPFAAINQKLPFQIIFFLFSLITFKFIPILSIRSVIILGGNVKYQEKQNKHKPKQTKNQNSVDFKIFSHF